MDIFINNLGVIISVVFGLIVLAVVVSMENKVKIELSKDRMIYEENYETKKTAILSCLNSLDNLVEKSEKPHFVMTQEDVKSVNDMFNEVFCSVNDKEILTSLIMITGKLQSSVKINTGELSRFKQLCRKELGFKSTVDFDKTIDELKMQIVENLTSARNESIKSEVSKANLKDKYSKQKEELNSKVEEPVKKSPNTSKQAITNIPLTKPSRTTNLTSPEKPKSKTSDDIFSSDLFSSHVSDIFSTKSKPTNLPTDNK